MEIGLGEDSGWEQGLQEEGCALRRGCVLGKDQEGAAWGFLTGKNRRSMGEVSSS